MPLSLLEQQVLAQTRRLIELVNGRFDLDLPQPEVAFDLHGKAAGMAVFPRSGSPRIRYNPAMLAQNRSAFIRQTVPHEVAHLAARALHGSRIRPHGAEWRSLMDFFGAEPERCHSYALQESRPRRLRYFPYRCGCRRHQLSAIRHNRNQAGVVYLCRRCGSPLRWVPDSES